MVPGEHNQIVAVQDMCAAKAGLPPHVQCIIRDLTKSAQVALKSTNLPASTTAAQLMAEASKLYSYDVDSFELILQTTKTTVNVHEHDSETLEELGFSLKGRNNLAICSKKNKETIELTYIPVTESSGISDKDLEEIKKEIKGKIRFHQDIQFFPETSYPSSTNRETSTPPAPIDLFYGNTYSNAVSRHEDTGFIGLVNQAMTCYLNSLLQTLFMTPEFRNTLYRWEFDGTEEEGSKSIPYQLQKLFLQLQTSSKAAVGTTELTTSFGWDSSEAWQQHDVQELCRVMFDALQQKFKNTKQADLISTLYEGKFKDYVKCLECGYESSREDTFSDVPLSVRPFGSSQAYASVEEALQAFVTPETLQESNQYFCEHCNKKCDAHKGLKFTKFPYLLTLQLKRFDFDPVTMHRIKLNDRVSFPEILNLNDFIKSENSPETCDDGDTTDSGSALDDEGIGYASGYKTGCSLSPEACSDNDLPDDDEGIDVGSHGPPMENNHELCVNERNLKKSMEKGPHVYELFSIMVHSGSANGGHYYAYIKCFSNGEWYCFNDAQVNKITYEDIQKTYGGGPSKAYYPSAYSSSTNAYMLMYRQIDKEKNAECMVPEEFPEHIKAHLQCMAEQEERDRIQKELDRSTCKIKLFCQHPLKKRMMEMQLKVHEDCSLKDATHTAHTIMNLDGIAPVDCCRLVKYDDYNDSIECSFDPKTDLSMGELLGGVKSSYKFDLLLEIKQRHEQFQEYKPGGVTIKVQVVDLEKEHVINSHLTVRSHLNSTVEELRKQVADALGVDKSEMRMVLVAFEIVFLNTPTNTLDAEGFHKSDKLFVEFKDAKDAEKPFSESKLYRVLDVYKHTINMRISLPKIDKAIVDRLRLHNCDTLEDQEDSSSEEEEGDKPDSSDSESERKIDLVKICGELIAEKQQDTIEKSKLDQGRDNNLKEDCDEGLGDSESGDTSSSIGYLNQQAMHSDQSEDSSLTDSERTLVGDELSPRNNSPDVMGSEIEQDLEPLHAGSEVTQPECDEFRDNKLRLLNSKASCPVHEQDDSRNMSSPEENTKDSKSTDSQSCKNSCVCAKRRTALHAAPVKKYFAALSYFDTETGEKMLRVYVDNRMTLSQLKKEIEPHVGIGADCFKIFRVYSGNQEVECTKLYDNLVSYGDDSKLTVKLGRALRKGEYMVNIFLLRINDTEPIRYLTDCVIVKNMTVRDLKEEILPQVREKCDRNIPLNRCRLRKKSWKTPGLIYLDDRKFESYHCNSNWEMFLEELPGPEPMTSAEQIALFTRMWHPSMFTLDPFKEVIIDSSDAESLRKALSEISQVPEEFIEFAKGKGTFPCEVSLLNIEKELVWQVQQNPSILKTNSWHHCKSLGVVDSDVIYYRDSREELKKLTEDERRIIMNKENARSNKNLKSSYSPKKEKGLKIYNLDSNSSNLHSKSSQSTSQSSAINVQSQSSQKGVHITSLCSINPELD